jgi:serine protease Do
MQVDNGRVGDPPSHERKGDRKTMNDTLRTKLNLLLTAVVAFAVGLGLAARMDLTPAGLARIADNPPLNIQVVEPMPVEDGILPQAGFSEIAERVTPAVVTIFVERTIPEHSREGGGLPPAFEDFFRQQQAPQRVRGSGSGFIVSEDGYIVTNNHVVEGADQINIQLADRREFTARLVGRDPTTDVALLKLDADNLTPVTLGSSDATRVGEWVLAIGSPGFRGVGGPLLTTVTAGIVSAKGRNINIIEAFANRNEDNLAIEDFIQTDAVINPGNSGGPLVNIRGEVIGVNSAIASNNGSYQGYGFAVPIDLVQEVIDDLVEYGEVRRALLGVSIQAVDDTEARYYELDEVAGAKVMGVNEGMAAARAGIRVGDVIVKVEGERVESVPDLQRKIRRHEPGETVAVTVVRRDDLKRETVEVQLMDAGDLSRQAAPQLVEAAGSDRLGIEVEDLTREIRRALDLPRGMEGVVIVSADEYGPYARRSLGNLRGTVITSINRAPISDVADYREAVEAVEPGDVVGIDIFNPESGQRVPLTVAIPK